MEAVDAASGTALRGDDTAAALPLEWAPVRPIRLKYTMRRAALYALWAD